jgi:tetratricopeptide (TPR) repeat protein
MEDIFAVQDEISGEIVQALTGTLGPRQAPEGLPARAAPTDSVEAYTVYLQARHQWKRRGAEPLRRSVALFEEALELDPDFARAWAGLAAAWVVLPGYVGEAVEDYHARATDAARRALAQDANLAEAHAVLAQIQSYQGDWSAADAAFFFAISLDPNDPTARHWYSLLLGQAGRLREALEQATKAYDLDPASPIVNYNLAQHLLALGYNERAQRHLQAAVELGFDSKANPSGDVILAYRRGDLARFAELAGLGPEACRGGPGHHGRGRSRFRRPLASPGARGAAGCRRGTPRRPRQPLDPARRGRARDPRAARRARQPHARPRHGLVPGGPRRAHASRLRRARRDGRAHGLLETVRHAGRLPRDRRAARLRLHDRGLGRRRRQDRALTRA